MELSFALENLRDFRISNSLMFATMNYVNNCLSTEEERRQLSEIFKYLDRDNDGVLSFDELVEGYTGVYSRSIAENIVDDIFLKIDMNHSGRLEYNEFVTYAMLSRKIVQENKLKAAFQMFDMNADGRISLEETKEVRSDRCRSSSMAWKTSTRKSSRASWRMSTKMVTATSTNTSS